MAKCAWQKVVVGNEQFLRPFDNESEKKLAEIIPFAPVTGNFSGSLNPRSLIQLNTYWKACDVFAENNELYPTKEKVDWWIRNELQFYNFELTRVVGDQVIFDVRSISVLNLKHIEANDYFSRAFGLMADEWGMTVDQFIREVKKRMGR